MIVILMSPTAAYTQFLEAVQTSGLVADSELASVAAAANGDQGEVGAQLVARGLLTGFQLKALKEGRGATLRIGNYDLLDRLGAGGMGTVFKARHRRMKRVVALKVLSAEISRDPLFVKRFQREVETIACLGHPNIVMAYDADEAEAGHFLVMEFVNGRDLAACVEREGPFTVSRAASCIEQAARGLAYAHQQEIVHRDIKPHNLLVDAGGVVKVTDLGLARLSHEAEAAPAAAAVTTAGGVLGTVDYMPPEQAIDSTAIDHRADIYSLGCTLHYLLTGRPPYAGATIMAILLKHRDAPIPRLTDLRPDVPPRMEALFQRMLAKEPALRVQTMSEVADELSAIARELAGEEKAIEWGPGETGAAQGAGSSSTIAMKQNPAMTLVYQPPAETQSVLVVEPSRVQASIMRKFLESLSLAEAGVASTGRDAMEMIRTKRPRAVLCALHLPDMSGLQLAELIRSEVKVQAPGFVLVTSEAGEVAAEALVKLRRVLPLAKPFTPNQLKAAIESVMVASVESMSFSIVNEPTTKRRIERGKARVLIVDDSGSARKYIRACLEKMGFTQFMEVPDGAQAIAMSARAFCDLIVTDYNMPLMDGRALVSYFKQNPATATIPIIMVTTESEPRVLDPVRRLGVTAIVAKNFPSDVVGPILDSLF